MKRRLFMMLACAVLGGALFALPAMATVEDGTIQPRTVEDGTIQPRDEAVRPTFELATPDSTTASLRFGGNLLIAGNNLSSGLSAQGLLLAFGNQLNLSTTSEYNFVAGNIIHYSATAKDLFVAGNSVTIAEEAMISDDVFATGNEIYLNTSLFGSFSAAANKVVISAKEIQGNVNLSADRIEFTKDVKINGTLNYNDNAVVVGLDSVTAAEKVTYSQPHHETTAADLWMGQLTTSVSLFVIIAILIVAFPGLKQRLEEEAQPELTAKNLLLGLGVLIAMPMLALALMMSVIGIVAGILLLVIYLILVFIAQGFTGVWLGKMVVEKAFKSNAPMLLEALIGIVIIGCVMMIPGLSTLASIFATVFGLGYLFASMRPATKAAEPKEEPKKLENPFRGQKKAATAKKTTTKAATTTKKTAKKTAAKKPAAKTAKK